MSRRWFQAGVGALAMLAGGALAGAPPEAPRHRFGEVLQGVVVEHEFALRNDSAEPMRITGAQVSPPLRLDRMPALVPAGGRATLKLKLDTSKIQGDYTGRVVVALGERAGEREFVLEGRVLPPIDVMPHPAFFISTSKGVSKATSLEIVNREESPLELSVTREPTAGKVALQTLEAGQRYRLTLTVAGDAPAGRTTDRIELQTSSSRNPVLLIGVNTQVRERVFTFPDVVDLGRVRMSNSRPAQTLMVYQTGGRDFSVRVQSDVAGLDVRAEPGPNGDRVQLTLSLERGNAKPGPIEGTLRLITNDPDFPEIRVPVQGAVLE